ncbi:MAG: 50S ribosomal protein L29 [Candidatus Kariarchaeaceae archaeon]|jgi:large subunit ribosomal protein L29
MAIMRMSEIRRLKPDQRDARLKQYRRELMDLRSMLSAGGSIDNPGRISAVKRTIARLITIQKEEERKKS